MTRNTEPMIAKRQAQAKQKEEYVLAVIGGMVDVGEKVTFYSVQKTTGCSKSYLHNNERIASAIRDGGKRTSRVPDEANAAVLLKAARLKIKELEKELAEYKSEESYKEKYEKLRKENAELKKQLETAYEYK